MEFDLNTVIAMLRTQLEVDLEDTYIYKPYAHALYKVWKTVNIQERPRNTETDK